MNPMHDQRSDEPRDTKKPYARPELATLGRVEDVSRSAPPINTSRPPILPEND